jgi:hypothetical protein
MEIRPAVAAAAGVRRLIGARSGDDRMPRRRGTSIGGVGQRTAQLRQSAIRPERVVVVPRRRRGKISAAESECSCSADSCQKARAAMGDLRSLLSDLDSAIRNGSAPPSDVVQRQDAIDKQIDEAAELTRNGK